jgi:predicted  nucleic acid-binding Zn-ribbon protein
MSDPVRQLVQLQDLDIMIREISDPERARELKTLGFEMTGLERLKTARAHLAQSIDKRWLVVYERLARKHGRAVVPVEDRTCLGCFQGLPGSFFSEISADQPVKLCENCGRILYLLNR